MSRGVVVADENIALHAITGLQAAGYRVIAIAREAPGLSDVGVLARAHEEGALLLTFDRDYGELIFKYGHPPARSVILLRSFPGSPEEMTSLLTQLLDGSIAGDVEGQFVVWARDGVRKRAFPPA